ncbi:MAG TPA: APC family permease, partial [Gemmataceae bacterium]|nr:APC family permease [Gemmataceae bacterium]
MKATLGLTGLTVNAMALIAPGAFLWLTYTEQAGYGAPMAGSDIWFGILAALALCFATAVSYAELAKLYPGAGSSYFFAEQAYLGKTHSAKFARVAKFIIGWASHLYYWVYPGLMVGVTALIVAYMAGDFFPTVFSSAVASPVLMILVCIVFAIGVGYIAYRGANTSTGVNLAVNVVQITALIIFAVIAIAYRVNHPDGSTGWTLDPDGNATKYSLVTFAVGADGNIGTFKKHSKDFDGQDDDGTIAQYVVEDDGGKPKTDKDGNYVFKMKDGKPIAALTYKVEVDADGDPKVDGKTWAFKKDKDGKLIPADTYKVQLDKDKNPVKDATGAYVFEKDPKTGDLVVDTTPQGQNLPSDQTNPDDHAAYYPDPKGVYVLDSTSGTQKAMALSDDDKKKETLETNYYLATDGDWWSAVAKPVPTDASKEHPLGDKFAASLLSLNYKPAILKATPTAGDTRQWFGSAVDVVKPHGFGTVFIQACVAILILVGFESVTSMGEEAKNPKKHIPYAILLSLAIQGGVCYLFEYFSANFFLNPGYVLTTAAGATAPIGDMMKLTGAWLFGSAAAGEWFMRIEALTVFLALIGTTLACLNTGARVTYAMGRDDEVPSHFGLLHGKNLTPHRAIWTLVILSIFIGILTVLFYQCGVGALAANDAVMDSPLVKGNFWYPSFLLFKSTGIGAWIPSSLVTVALISNFGTFLLYMLTCWIAIVAFREHHTFNGIKHMVIPVFGLLANLACMLFYLFEYFSANFFLNPG